MKKLIALLLTLAMMLGCTAFAMEAADYVGYWVLSGVEVSGMALDPAALGVSAYMELYSDGTCLMVAQEEQVEGTWEVTETGISSTDANGEVDEYTWVDGTLVVEEEGMKMVFSQEAFTQPLMNLTVADFNGTWELSYMEVGADVYSTEEMGMTATLTLADGKGHLTMSDAESTEEYDAVCEVEESEGFGTVMYFLTVDAEGQQDGSGLMLLMFDNGELVWYDWDDEYEYFNCFVRVEE